MTAFILYVQSVRKYNKITLGFVLLAIVEMDN